MFLLKKIKSGNARSASPKGDQVLKMGVEDLRDVHGMTENRGLWTLKTGVEKDGEKRQVTVFIEGLKKGVGAVYGKAHYDVFTREVKGCMLPPAGLREPIQCVTDALSRHRTLRHPDILQFVAGGQVSPKSTDIRLITEQAVPLRVQLAERKLSIDELCLGITSVARALKWLNEECRIAYNNVTLDGIFVTASKPRWVLGDFSFSCHRDAEDIVQHSMQHQPYVAPEDVFPNTMPHSGRSSPTQRRRSCGTQAVDLVSRDVYGLGCLIDELFGYCEDESITELRDQLLELLIDETKGDDLDVSHGVAIPSDELYEQTGSFEDRIADRGLEALLSEVVGAIEWLSKGDLPSQKLITKTPDSRALNVKEELCLWSLGAMHKDPWERPSYDDLMDGRFITGNALVRCVAFLTSERLGASEPELVAGYAEVIRCFDACQYQDVLSYIVPLLCDRGTFLDTLADDLYSRLLAPRKKAPALVPGRSAAQAAGEPEPEQDAITDHDLDSFAIGTMVEATGLIKAPELNGLRGKVAGVEDNRILVVFDGPQHCQRALKPDHLKKPSAEELRTSGLLNPIDYQKAIVPFLKSVMHDKLDYGLRAALLRRAKYFVGTFDHSCILPDVISCLQDPSQSDELRAAACDAVPALVSSMVSGPPKVVMGLLVPLHKLIHDKEVRLPVKSAAVRAAILTWGTNGTSFAVSACTTAFHNEDLRIPALEAMGQILQTDLVPPEEVSGVAIPLLSPLTLSPSPDVRDHTHTALKAAFAILSAAGGIESFPPPRPLPTPASFVASLPRAQQAIKVK